MASTRKRLRRVSIAETLAEPSKRRRTADDSSYTDQEKVTHSLGYQALLKICESNPPEDGILKLWFKSKQFEILLNSKAEIRPDLMKLIIRAVHLCTLSDQVTQHAEEMLRIVIKTNFMPLHLSSFVRQIPFRSRTNDGFQPDLVIMHLAESFFVLLQRFGNEVVDSTPVAELSEALEKLKSDHDVQLQKYTEMLEQKVNRVKELRDEIIRRKIESLRKKENESELEPPQNFREVSVIPQAADLNLHSKPFLRANVVGGSYKDLEHYLDVQFRLLREDFILPLRRGIEQLRKDNISLEISSVSDSKHANNMSIYRHVTVLYPVCNGKGMVYKIRFDNSHRSLRRVKWDKSKRLKFGSLLCLSADDFYNLLFATVENRDKNDLYCGELEVRFEGVELERLSQSIEQKEEFDMVESPAFFEAYRHVLEGLQKIKPDELPFQEHIINCHPIVGPPEYESKTKGFFDMSDVMNKAAEVSVNAIGLDKTMEEEILDSMSTFTDDVSSDDNSEESLDSDSDHRRLRSRAIKKNYGANDVNIYDLQLDQVSSSFNESQTRAFKMALTKKIAVIQGPPGTGKTYVGQKIARVLLQSASLWQDDEKRPPILMVSYTNHSLDEFLGGIPKEGRLLSVTSNCRLLKALNLVQTKALLSRK